MKKRILSCALAIAGAVGSLCAQTNPILKYYYAPPTEKMFNASPSWTNLSDKVYLQDAELTFELRDVHDYAALRGLADILRTLKTDMLFYRDSLENGAGNVRIDHVVYLDKEQRALRFTKHRKDGETFIVLNGETQRLKIERDTIRIVVNGITHKPGTPGGPANTKDSNKPRPSHPAQLTLVMNNYADLDKVIAKMDVVYQAMDSFVAARSGKEISQPRKYPSTCHYYPYGQQEFRGGTHIIKLGLAERVGYENRPDPNHGSKLTFFCNVMAGLVRSAIAPGADAGIALNEYYRRDEAGDHFFTAASISMLSFFDRDDKDYFMHNNFFVNLERGEVAQQRMMGLDLQGYSWGVGYLASRSGDQFKDLTMRLYSAAWLKSGIIIAPEVIATDKFRHIFPGIAVKIPVIRS